MDKVIRINELPSIPGYTPAGKAAFHVSISDGDEEDGHFGFFGPQSLLSCENTPQDSLRLAGWVSRALLQADENEEDIQNALLHFKYMDQTNGTYGMYLKALDSAEVRTLWWPDDIRTHELSNIAEAEDRAIALLQKAEHIRPEVAQSSSSPKPKI